MRQKADTALRAPRPSDREAVERIVTSSGFFSPDEVGVALEVFDEAVADPSSGYSYCLAELDGEVVGLACWGSIEMTESSFDLYWIAVDDGVRGCGVGQLLLAAAEQDASAAGCSQLIVETSGRDQYAPTHAFYERCGYERQAELPDFYAPGDAKVFYVKTFGPALTGGRTVLPSTTTTQLEVKRMNVRPLYDRVVVRPLEAETTTIGGIVIPHSAAEKSGRGQVLAVGPGALLDDGRLRALAVKVGDHVLYGNYSGSELKLDGEELLVIRESEILAVLVEKPGVEKAA